MIPSFHPGAIYVKKMHLSREKDQSCYTVSMVQLTEKTFFYYAKCPKWVRRLVVHGEHLDDLQKRLIDDGLLPEVMERLLAIRGKYSVVEDEDQNDAFSRTVEFMRSGVQTIYGGVLVHGHWVARPDVLERVEGKSALGLYYYVAVDIKRLSDPRSIRDEHKMQGAFYAELLERVQEVKPTSGYMMTSSGVVMRYDLERFEAEYRLTLDHIERILAGEEPAHLLTSGCKTSPFFNVCVDETEDCDDLSLLNRIQATEVEELNGAGVQTVLELASANVEDLADKMMDMPDNRLRFLHRQAVSLKERVHDVVEAIPFTTSNVELYFDIESDPVRDLDYLFGVLEVVYLADRTTQETYHSFLATSEAEEERAWNDFALFLHQHKQATLYHYGWLEISVCAKLIDRYGAPEGAITSWENNFVDLNAQLRSAVIFPLPFNSLKDLAKYIGFSWRAEDASGVNSIRWYHDWLERGDKSLLERVVQYNEDDVRATYLLKTWLAKQKPSL
ncbi:TPA: hypothetical protein DEB00_03020 [Candidatus Uhrbacteria bacterium]|nr:hypothetical protein [Candidatus Uhrbacteria bacterium]